MLSCSYARCLGIRCRHRRAGGTVASPQQGRKLSQGIRDGRSDVFIAILVPDNRTLASLQLRRAIDQRARSIVETNSSFSVRRARSPSPPYTTATTAYARLTFERFVVFCCCKRGVRPNADTAACLLVRTTCLPSRRTAPHRGSQARGLSAARRRPCGCGWGKTRTT